MHGHHAPKTSPSGGVLKPKRQMDTFLFQLDSSCCVSASRRTTSQNGWWVLHMQGLLVIRWLQPVKQRRVSQDIQKVPDSMEPLVRLPSFIPTSWPLPSPPPTPVLKLASMEQGQNPFPTGGVGPGLPSTLEGFRHSLDQQMCNLSVKLAPRKGFRREWVSGCLKHIPQVLPSGREMLGQVRLKGTCLFLNYWWFRCFPLGIWFFCSPTKLEHYKSLGCLTVFLIFQSWESGRCWAKVPIEGSESNSSVGGPPASKAFQDKRMDILSQCASKETMHPIHFKKKKG